MSVTKLETLRDERISKLKALRDLGINPYPSKSKKNISNKDVVEKYAELEGKTYTIAGRLISWREHGPIVFGHVADESGKVQLYIKKDVIEDTSVPNQNIGFEHFSLLDVGDFVEAEGEVTKTQKGEISILVKKLRILAKSLRPLPDKWDGLSDLETRFRRRYLDLATNPEIRARFARKAEFWRLSREFLHNEGFIEVETPILEEVTGGADATPFVTHHNDLDQDFFLRISTELYQKRLIGGGFEKVYTFGPNFRNEGTSDEHLQEYYQLEWYCAYADYRDNMALVKKYFQTVIPAVYGKSVFTTRGHTFDLAKTDWEEIDYAGAIKEHTGIDIFTATDDEMLAVIKKHHVTLSGDINHSRLIDNLWKIVRKTITGPAFLVNEPKFMSPLAKSKPEDETITERFHVIIAGSELGNGYSELNDPQDQLARFQEQQAARDAGDSEAQMLDIDFVEMLEYGMPPTSGYAHSERVFWFLEDVPAREGTLFPLMRHDIDPITKSIYDL